MNNKSGLTIGIDATNLRCGGGLTHLIELLRVAQPNLFSINKVIVWGGLPTLNALDDRSWLFKHNPAALEKGLLRRILWQRYSLSSVAREEDCDLLFVPGGSYAGNFHPVITMSRNLLPFEIHELLRYGLAFRTLKFLLLRFTQSRSYKKTDGVIFLTKYAQDAVLKVTGKLNGRISIIPHGMNSRFSRAPKSQRDIKDFNNKNPYRVLYVSIIDQYKHQWNVVEAVSMLRKLGFPIVLDLVGPAYLPALKRLNKTLSRLDVEHSWVNYHGAIAFDDLHQSYANADLGVFASSCENMPNILLETMASGLPIACSELGPMPEVLSNTGVYFHPEQASSIASAIQKLIESPQLRTELSQASYERVQQFSWKRCADETFGFLSDFLQQKNIN